MRNHAKSSRSGGSWAGIETERPERAAEPLIFPYDAWLGVSNFVVLATAHFYNTLVIWLLQIYPVPRAIKNNSPSHVLLSTMNLKLWSAVSLFLRSCQWLVKVTCEKHLKRSRLWDNGRAERGTFAGQTVEQFVWFLLKIKQISGAKYALEVSQKTIFEIIRILFRYADNHSELCRKRTYETQSRNLFPPIVTAPLTVTIVTINHICGNID